MSEQNARSPHDIRLLACNYAVGTSPVAEGALCYVSNVAFNRSTVDRVHIIARSRCGRWIYKWENIQRLRNFRLKTIPPEHPRYKDYRTNHWQAEEFLSAIQGKPGRRDGPWCAGPDQAYYWTEAWQAGEREADEDLAAGRTRTFATADEAIAWLQSDDD